MNVLVLDGAQRAALATVRSLGRAGYPVTVAEEKAGSLAAASHYCRGERVYPSPATGAAQFLDWMERQGQSGEFHAVLPITEITTDLLLRHRHRWPSLTLPFAGIDTIDALTDKVSLYRRATALGVPVPDSVIVSSDADLTIAQRQIGFPAILKPRRSRLWTGDGFRATSVRRVHDRGELDALLALPEFSDEAFLYQRCVPGEGQGLFALYRHGTPVVFFGHRRLREKPPEGGVSVLSESCHPDERLRAYAQRLLDDAQWHGVAMVEFKVCPREGPFLMEINARFWGSLQLAVDAGIDFPRLLLDDALGRGTTVPPVLQTGRRLRWFLGDLDRLYLVLKHARDHGGARVMTEIARFLRPDFGRTRHEVFRWDDPRPALRELVTYLRRA